MGDPKLERSEKKNPYRARFRFKDDDGTVWTVWDTTFSNSAHHVRPHADPSATERVFVNQDGVRRSYPFVKGESHVLEIQALERQSREAQLLGEMSDKGKRTPW
jgi:hypothetical protein